MYPDLCFKQNKKNITIFQLTIYVLEQKEENNVYLCKPKFYYIKVGCKEYTLHGHVIMMSQDRVSHRILMQNILFI